MLKQAQIDSLRAAIGDTHSRRVRNPPAALDIDWVLQAEVDEGDAEGRIAGLEARPAIEPAERAARLLRAVALMDLTTLGGDDTAATVRRLCAQARHSISPELLEAYGVTDLPIRPAAVCIYHHFIPVALEALSDSGIALAVVSAGFPHGLSPLRQRIDEVRASVEAGASEIDVVILRAHVLTGEWEALHAEVRAFREACGDAQLKVILATGELRSLTNVARASRVCMLAGADFIKTSTGKEAVNATLSAGWAMAGAIRAYHERTGYQVGLKPAGGIRSADQALSWMLLVEEELGEEWLRPPLFRFGASSLLGDVEQALQRLLPAVRRPTAGMERLESGMSD
jgi:deoxyribose-phosphate aldolase